MRNETPTAVVTGASRGLGLALTRELARRGWRIVADARDGDRLDQAVADLTGVTRIAGDVADPAHRRRLADAVADGVDLVVNNASMLGPSPQPRLADYPLDVLEHVYAVNTIAPLALIQALLPALRARHGRVIDISSDAAVEPYEGWGGYGSSKAALDQLTAILGAEEPGIRVYTCDPGDMNTDLHQQAFPGEDISDRPAPVTVVPALLRLVEGDLPNGRYRAADLGAEVPA
ncbi:MAG TPA: SDR family oxidoreductase [Amycolatopsis sp.]|nr:SDR family oxidoreductase [Amycolatopsis sp.]